MGAFVIANVNQSTFYIILSLFCMASSFFFLFLRKPLKASDDFLNPTLSDSAVEPQPSSEPESNLMKDLTETAKLVIDRRMLLVEPLILQTALGIAVQAAIMVP
jgi:hypothetical protein